MLIVARTLVALSVLLTLAAIETWRVHYLPIGFEATGVFSFYFFVLATVTALSALVIVTVHLRSGQRTGFALVAVSSAICLLVLAGLLADFFVEAWWRSS
jgi:phosphate starvation-inducible membrane PsiE